jgi:mRNA guanylyltransferase
MPATEVPDIERVGKALNETYERTLRRMVSSLMELSHDRFPGAQPVSFAHQHLKELENENYFVSEKADGVRCLMFCNISPDGSYETFLVRFHSQD